MWSEEINKKIQEAETNNDPSSHDESWEKMEVLLNKHLPLKKKRRRFIFFLFPLLLGAGTVFFILQKKDKHDLSISQQQSTVHPSTTPADSPIINETDRIVSSNKRPFQLIPEKTIETTEKSLERKVKSENSIPGNRDYKRTKENSIRQKKIFSQPSLQEQEIAVTKKETRTKNKIDKNPVAQPPSLPVINKNQQTEKTVTATDSLVNIEKTTVAENNIKNDDSTQIELKSEKKKLAATKRISLNFSVGPDISSVGIDPGTLTLQYGVGVSFALSKNISLRTGFFSGHKIYAADSTNYKPPYTINDLQRVEANCLVYEIPVTLVYHFSTMKKHSWFLSSGLSSYLMKRETYDYYYKNTWGQPQSYSRTYKNENSHLFSVINLSGGYQYNVSDRLTILAEPYIKIPVKGIGVGKVNLNSGGLLFTVGFKPFLKKN